MSDQDRELLELAAKAAGYKDPCWEGDSLFVYNNEWLIDFNPLISSGEAMDLAATLKMDVLQDSESVSVKRYVGPGVDHQYLAQEQVTGCRFKATRRAIVCAAAEIGRSMP